MTGCCRMGSGAHESQKWGIELEQFEPHHFRPLNTHINQIIQTHQFQQENRMGLHVTSVKKVRSAIHHPI